MISACWLLYQTIREVLPEVEWVSLLPLLTGGKWGSLNWCGFIVSPAVWSNEHITHPPHPQICGTVRTSVFTPYEILFGTAALDDHLSIAAAFRSGCFLKHKPLVFITTVALSYTNCLLIQLQESSWTIQKWNAVTSKRAKRDVLYRVSPEGGARCRKCC